MVRRLAAILSADIAGYSRLMGADEAGMLAALRQLRAQIFGPTVAGNRGRIVKAMGDGWLVEFASAVDAVTCAMQVQDRLADEPAIRIRIGVHIGDVTHEDDDIFGDGVNIAARLQEIAEPGGVLVSDPVYGAIDGTLRPSFDDHGERALKNIARPVRTWARAAVARAPDPSRHAGAGEAVPAGFPRLAIAPVAASDTRPEVRELADAITGDLAAYLGSSAWMTTRIDGAAEAGAYRLTAGLRARGERLRLEARLNSADGAALWSGKYDGTLADGFDWQDRVAEDVAAEVYGMLLDAERRRIAARPAAERTAVDFMLAGIMEYSLVDAQALRRTIEAFRAAIERDPGSGFAYAQAARSLNSARSAGYDDIVADYAGHYEGWLEQALAHAPSEPALQLAFAYAGYHRDRDAAPMRRAVQEALRRAPFDVEVLAYCGWLGAYIGEPEAALECFDKVVRLGRVSPFAILIHTGRALACVQGGRDEDAVGEARKALAVSADYPTPYRILAAALAHLGRREEAARALAEVLRLVPGDTISATAERSAFLDTSGVRRYLDGLRRAGMPE